MLTPNEVSALSDAELLARVTKIMHPEAVNNFGVWVIVADRVEAGDVVSRLPFYLYDIGASFALREKLWETGKCLQLDVSFWEDEDGLYVASCSLMGNEDGNETVESVVFIKSSIAAAEARCVAEVFLLVMQEKGARE